MIDDVLHGAAWLSLQVGAERPVRVVAHNGSYATRGQLAEQQFATGRRPTVFEVPSDRHTAVA